MKPMQCKAMNETIVLLNTNKMRSYRNTEMHVEVRMN